MLSVLPMYLFPLEIQSVFLKDLGLRFLMYKLENLCLRRFFPHYSETSGNLLPKDWEKIYSDHVGCQMTGVVIWAHCPALTGRDSKHYVLRAPGRRHGKCGKPLAQGTGDLLLLQVASRKGEKLTAGLSFQPHSPPGVSAASDSCWLSLHSLCKPASYDSQGPSSPVSWQVKTSFI